MFVAAGVGAYGAAIFHLGTHAFFKALLFLGSGSVIHAMGGEQDMQKMGGLKRQLPVTHLTFLVAAGGGGEEGAAGGLGGGGGGLGLGGNSGDLDRRAGLEPLPPLPSAFSGAPRRSRGRAR